ncbi:putative non-specific serine/threonine protein kinase [Rosa chinensis]|uniref:Putative non-specific serine/threonine protein kinase n=1 Tax=Rosa chinensis TaxID=74649 RepID=A0A2P6RE36_ROSCH|nr:putative non-specific serine/threonine protein kinase [Rosa chinensis]
MIMLNFSSSAFPAPSSFSGFVPSVSLAITMKVKPFLTPLYLSLFLHILVFVAGASPPIYTPVEDITLTCGASRDQFNRYDNRTWRGDINSKLFPIIGNTSQVRKAPSSSSSMASQVPHTTARLSHSEFTYTFNQLTAGQLFIRLYFYPASYANFYRSKAHFSVKANYFTLLDDFNASATADAYGVDTLYREFCLNIDKEQSLNITFTPSKVKDAYALINGIEIVSMPADLYYSPANSTGIDYVNDKLKLSIGSDTALEMVYRLNIGGSSPSNTEDTGMYRKWESDDRTYLDDSSLHFSILQQNSSIELNFTTIPNYTAPKEVYQTGRSMGMNKTISKSYNLTWEFPVDSFFYYLVRLHFCEFEPNITRYGDLVFQIYIDNKTVEDTADIIQLSGGNGIPVYRDYIVYMSSHENEKKVSLFLALATVQKDWLTSYGDAILNGLEIFKLLNSNGSKIADTNPNSPSTTPRVKGPKSLNTWTPLLAIVAGVVSSTLTFSVFRLLVFRRG